MSRIVWGGIESIRNSKKFNSTSFYSLKNSLGLACPAIFLHAQGLKASIYSGAEFFFNTYPSKKLLIQNSNCKAKLRCGIESSIDLNWGDIQLFKLIFIYSERLPQDLFQSLGKDSQICVSEASVEILKLKLDF